MARPLIVHVSADYPDAIRLRKTPVIERLVRAASAKFDQQVYSLNRESPGLGGWAWPKSQVRFRDEGDGLCSVVYEAPPRGIHHRRQLIALGEALAERMAGGRQPDLIVGHKLTVEGFAVARAAALLGVPYALSIQGNTDLKILAARPDLRAALGDIFHEAGVVFPMAPWALNRVEAMLGKRRGATCLLPCIVENESVIAPEPGSGIVSAFHLHNYRQKNLPRLAASVDLTRLAEPDLALTLYGGSEEAEINAVRRLCGNRIALIGHVDNAELSHRIHAARGFALPSLRESFGLVFVEALMAGTPILYPCGAAVDGWFDNCPFALPVDARDVKAIAAGLLTLYREEECLKAELAAWQMAGGLDRFGKAVIAQTFADAVNNALLVDNGRVDIRT